MNSLVAQIAHPPPPRAVSALQLRFRSASGPTFAALRARTASGASSLHLQSLTSVDASLSDALLSTSIAFLPPSTSARLKRVRRLSSILLLAASLGPRAPTWAFVGSYPLSFLCAISARRANSTYRTILLAFGCHRQLSSCARTTGVRRPPLCSAARWLELCRDTRTAQNIFEIQIETLLARIGPGFVFPVRFTASDGPFFNLCGAVRVVRSHSGVRCVVPSALFLPGARAPRIVHAPRLWMSSIAIAIQLRPHHRRAVSTALLSCSLTRAAPRPPQNIFEMYIETQLWRALADAYVLVFSRRVSL
ncbi:hypothetical protein DFH07DRAFT_151362 [Mycena maculata]|uniref:Uncharacterized protein n=1 Tax=Mycena maculata TaxID=230809 RepID=A0AAD7I0Q3_9AGAR|nr:hypothetical protein DFH07DRAFT_151362 [Mycena maculata]